MASNNKVLMQFLRIVILQEGEKTLVEVSELVQRTKASEEQVKTMVVLPEQPQILFSLIPAYILIEKVNLFLRVSR